MADKIQSELNIRNSLDYFFKDSSTWKKYNNMFAYIVFFSSLLLFFTKNNEVIFNSVKIINILALIAVFISFYKFNYEFLIKADSTRIKNFIGNSFDSNLVKNPLESYYTRENIKPGLFKALVNLCESSFFTKKITSKMYKKEQKKIFVFLTILLISSYYSYLNKEFFSLLLGFFLSGNILISFIRLIKMNIESKFVYDMSKLLLESNSYIEDSKILYLLLRYETSISRFSVLLDSKVYNEINENLNESWQKYINNVIYINHKDKFNH